MKDLRDRKDWWRPVEGFGEHEAVNQGLIRALPLPHVRNRQ